MLFRGSKNYEGIKKTCLEYFKNIKMLGDTMPSIFQQTKKFDKDPKEAKMDELCKQFEKLYLMMIKQPRQSLKQAEPFCYKCGKRRHYGSQCRMEQELMS